MRPIFTDLFLAIVLILACLGSSSVDGFQTVTEQVTSPRYQRFLDDLFQQFDKNQDGVIQQVEHENVYLPLLKLADGNRNTEVTREEVVEWLQKNTEQEIRNKLLHQLEKDVQQKNNLLLGPNPGAAKMLLAEQQPKLNQEVDISFVVLELPEDFAKQELVSLKDLAKVVAGKNFDKKELANNGIKLLQLYEFSAADSTECRLGFGYPEQFDNGYFYSKSTDGGIGTKLTVLPEVVRDRVLLDMEFSAVLSNKSNLRMRKFGVKNSLVFTTTEPIKLINLYSEGVHYLLIVSAKV